jgi:cytochrome d ubiquinol oxidase subunit I
MEDVVLLSRIQFALTVMFHYLFPPLTIGMGVVLVYLGGQYLRTRDPVYEAQRFWTRIFALNFAIGVASGIVMEFQFGTNWATYSRFVGDVFGSALAAEGIFAFFLESGFLAVLVFGWDRVSGRRCTSSPRCMVALGSIFSSGLDRRRQQLAADAGGLPPSSRCSRRQPWSSTACRRCAPRSPTSGQLVFNPSTVHRLMHVWIGCFIMGAFFIMSISAWYLLKGKHTRSSHEALVPRRAGPGDDLVAGGLFSGHFQAKNVYEHQPAKLAAFEAHYTTGPGGSSRSLRDPQRRAAGPSTGRSPSPAASASCSSRDFARSRCSASTSSAPRTGRRSCCPSSPTGS